MEWRKWEELGGELRSLSLATFGWVKINVMILGIPV